MNSVGGMLKKRFEKQYCSFICLALCSLYKRRVEILVVLRALFSSSHMMRLVESCVKMNLINYIFLDI